MDWSWHPKSVNFLYPGEEGDYAGAGNGIYYINNSKIKNARWNPFVVHALDSVKTGHFKTPLLILLILW